MFTTRQNSNLVKRFRDFLYKKICAPPGVELYANNFDLSDSLQYEFITGVQSRQCAQCAHSQFHRLVYPYTFSIFDFFNITYFYFYVAILLVDRGENLWTQCTIQLF